MNPIYLVLPLLSMCVFLVLFAYLLLILPRRRLDFAYALTFFSFFLLSIGDLGVAAAGADLRLALYMHNISIIGGAMLGGILLYLSLSYPFRTRWMERRRNRLAVYALGVVPYLFFANAAYNSVYSSPSATLLPGGYYDVGDLTKAAGAPIYPAGSAYILVLIAASMAIHARRFGGMRGRPRQQALTAVAGLGLFVFLSLFIEFGVPAIWPGLHLQPILGPFAAGVVFSFGVIKYRHFTIPSRTKPVSAGDPVPQELLPGGSSHYVVDESSSDPKTAYWIFRRHLESGMPGFVITTKDPEMMCQKYGIVDVPCVFIGDRKAFAAKYARSMTVFYATPDFMMDGMKTIDDFLSGSSGRVVLVDAFDIFSDIASSPPERRGGLMGSISGLARRIAGTGVRILISVEPSWMRGEKPGAVVPSGRLAMRSRLWSAMMLENSLNTAIENLPAGMEPDVARALDELALSDAFFQRVRYFGGKFSISMDAGEDLTGPDAVRHLKAFLERLGSFAVVDMSKIMDSLAQAGISRFEYEMEPGGAYLVSLRAHGAPYKLFVHFLQKGYSCIYLGRTPPRLFGTLSASLRQSAVHRWITDFPEGALSIPPRLEYIRREVEDFINDESRAPKAVFLDNAEYLVKYTGSFDAVHLFIANLKDMVIDSGGILAVTVSPGTFRQEDAAALTRELVALEYERV